MNSGGGVEKKWSRIRELGTFIRGEASEWKEFVGVKGKLYTPIDREGVLVGQWND